MSFPLFGQVYLGNKEFGSTIRGGEEKDRSRVSDVSLA